MKKSHLKPWSLLGALLLISALFSGCSSDEGVALGVPTGTPVSAQIAQTQGSAAKGTTFQMSLLVTFSDGTSKGTFTRNVTEDATWSSSKPDVATVSNTSGTKGLVSGLKAGTTNITADYANLPSSVVTFTVTNAELQQIGITPGNPTIVAGASQQLTATGIFTDGTTQNITQSVTWVSSETDVLTVDTQGESIGRARGIDAGTSIVTASLQDLSGQISVQVTAPSLSSLAVEPANASIAKGTKRQFTARATYDNGNVVNVSADVQWSSEDEGVATVANTGTTKGQATGLTLGTSVITATFGGKSATANLTVTAAELVSLEVSPSNPSIAKGYEQQFTATGIYSDDTTQDLSSVADWSSTAMSVATVGNADNDKGLAQGLTAGSSQIKAVFQGITGSTTLTVTDAVLDSLALDPLNSSVPLNRSKQFTATGTFSDGGTPQDVTESVIWASSDEAVATISNAPGSKGLISPLAEGETSITATDPNNSSVKATTNLTVIAPATVQSIEVTPADETIAKGTKLSYTAIAYYAANDFEDVTLEANWDSSDKAVATISNEDTTTGEATAVSVGTSNITAEFMGVTGATDLTVSAAVLTSIGISPTNPSAPVGVTQQFIATGTYSDNSTQNITNSVIWNSSNTAVAGISNTTGKNGQALGNSQGTTIISAEQAGLTKTTQFLVTTAALQSLQIDPVNANLANGFQRQYKATGIYSDGTRRALTGQVTWSSSDVNLATISNVAANNGLSTAAANGTGEVLIRAVLGEVTRFTTLTITDATLDDLEISPLNKTLPEGVEQQYVATGVFSDASTQDLSSQVNWSSSASNIASISTTGLVKGLDVGASVIRATLKSDVNEIAETDVNIIDAVVQSLAVSPATKTLAQGRTENFTATATYSNNTTANVTNQVTWTSSDEAIAEVSNAGGTEGQATAVSPGEAAITATHPDGPVASSLLTVTDKVLDSIAVSPATVEIAKGNTQAYVAEGTYSDGTTDDLSAVATWNSSNDSIASISNEGLATAHAIGDTNIQATYDNVTSDPVLLRVKKAALSSITVTPQGAQLAAGLESNFVATGIYSDNTDKVITDEVTWTSLNTPVAVVSNSVGQKGLVSAKSAGNATIRASSGAVSGDSDLTVTAAVLEHIVVETITNTLPNGYSVKVVARGLYSDGSEVADLGANVNWTTTDNTIASVSASGLVSGLALGTASIVATSIQDTSIDGGAGMTVTAETLVSLTIDNNDADNSLSNGQSTQFWALGSFSGATPDLDLTTQVQWISSNPSSIAITQQGRASAGMVPGASNITATRASVTSNGVVMTRSLL